MLYKTCAYFLWFNIQTNYSPPPQEYVFDVGQAVILCVLNDHITSILTWKLVCQFWCYTIFLLSCFPFFFFWVIVKWGTEQIFHCPFNLHIQPKLLLFYGQQMQFLAKMMSTVCVSSSFISISNQII